MNRGGWISWFVICMYIQYIHTCSIHYSIGYGVLGFVPHMNAYRGADGYKTREHLGNLSSVDITS